uniref:Uncharacterized protein n=1 Tax=Anguilla anguilla TaxID=7936 RepID=A0A0E9RLH8_ANGAN
MSPVPRANHEGVLRPVADNTGTSTHKSGQRGEGAERGERREERSTVCLLNPPNYVLEKEPVLSPQ